MDIWTPGTARPRFSVVVPAYDEQAVIGSCLESLLAQDYRGPVQILVVDNNSHDATAAVARRYGVDVVSEPRPGVCSARERGRRAAAGEVIVSVDADTTYGTDWLRLIDERFRARPDAVAVAGPCRFVDAPRWGEAWQRLLFGMVALLARVTGRVCYVTATNLAFRADAFGGYDVRLTQGGDELDVLRRLRQRGPVLFAADNPSYTSSRRLHRGLAYNLVVSLGYYYLLGYWLNRLAGRRVLGTAPSFRPFGRRARRGWPSRLLAAGALLGVLLIAWGVGEYEGLL